MVINVNETDKHNYIIVIYSLLFNVHVAIVYAMGGKLNLNEALSITMALH
jgi:hypothetical protein